MQDMVLLGAGASVEAGVPHAYAMTNRIIHDFEQDPYSRTSAHVAKFVVGGLLFQQGIRGSNPLDSGVNVEEFFSAVQLLAERNELEAAPFVGSWHAMVEELDQESPASLRLEPLLNAIYEAIRDEILEAFGQTPSSSDMKQIDDTLQKAVAVIVEASLRKKTPTLHPGKRLGKSVNDYLSEVVAKWSARLKQHRPRPDFKFRQAFQQAVSDSQLRPGEGRVFDRTAALMIQSLKRLVWVTDEEKVTYLMPLVVSARQYPRFVIATLNYDNCVELAAQTSQIPYDTGISHWSKTGEFDMAGEGLRLLKLHGSIDWRKRQVVNDESKLPTV